MSCSHQYNEDYYIQADLMMEELCTQIMDIQSSIESHLCSIKKHVKRFRDEEKSNAEFLGFNALYCHYGDQIKTELKGRDMDTFKNSTEILKCYNDIKRNNLQSAKDYLDEAQRSLCDEVPCERTAFNCRVIASWCLQNAWTTKDQVKEFYKRNAKEFFQKCKEHLQQLSQQHPTCRYLTALHIKASTSVIFLKMKLCWFLFDRQSMINRFDLHRPGENGMEKAEQLITLAKQEARLVEDGSAYYYHIQHKLLLVQFFYNCRVAQNKGQRDQRENAATTAHNLLQQLKRKYPNDTNWNTLSALLESLKGQLNNVYIIPLAQDQKEHKVLPDYSSHSSEVTCQEDSLSDLPETRSTKANNDSQSEDCL